MSLLCLPGPSKQFLSYQNNNIFPKNIIPLWNHFSRFNFLQVDHIANVLVDNSEFQMKAA